MTHSFSSNAVSQIIGIPFGVVDYWDRIAFIKPSISEASGYGSVRLYSFTDLIQFEIAKFLRDQGLPLQKIRRSLHFLKNRLHEIEQPLSRLRFLTDGETIFVLTDRHKEIVDTLKTGHVLAIAIKKLVTDLRERTSKITMGRPYRVNVANRRYTFFLHPDLEDGGYRVQCSELSANGFRGYSIEEAMDTIRDAIQDHHRIRP